MLGVGRMLMIVGGALLLLGALLSLGARIPWLGRLPGDIVIERDNFRFYLPITTSIVDQHRPFTDCGGISQVRAC